MDNPDFFNLIYDALDEKLLYDEAVAAHKGSGYDSSDFEDNCVHPLNEHEAILTVAERRIYRQEKRLRQLNPLGLPDLTSTNLLSSLLREELADNKENGTLSETDLQFRNRVFQSEFGEPTSSKLHREAGASLDGDESPEYLADDGDEDFVGFRDMRPCGGKKQNKHVAKKARTSRNTSANKAISKSSDKPKKPSTTRAQSTNAPSTKKRKRVKYEDSEQEEEMTWDGSEEMSEQEESESEEDDASVGLFVDRTPSLISSAQFDGGEDNFDGDASAVLEDRPSPSGIATSSAQTTPATSFGQPTPTQAPTARNPLVTRQLPAVRQAPAARPARS